MKYAFMTFSCKDASLDEVLALARRTGYEGVELRSGGGHAHGVEVDTGPNERATVKRKCAEAGIEPCCIAISARFADPADAAEWVAETEATIELASDIGSPVIRVFGGKLGEEVSRGEAVEAVAGHLRGLASEAEAHGVTLAMETHDAWCDAAHVAAVMRLVDHPAVGVNWDVMHPGRAAGYSLEASFELLKPWIRHLHFHDAMLVPDKLDFRKIGEGEIDHRVILRQLAGIGYTGYLSGEWIGFGDEAQVAHDRRAMAALEEELGLAAST
jgi:sugar phosphate isomerase/epimerase